MSAVSASRDDQETGSAAARSCRADLDRSQADEWRLDLGGRWTREVERPSPEAVTQDLAENPPKRLIVAEKDLQQWDSTLLAYLLRIAQACDNHDIQLDTEALRPGLRELLQLARTVPERQPEEQGSSGAGPLSRIGGWGLSRAEYAVDTLAFFGETTLALLRMVVGQARYRRVDLLEMLRFCGPDALPIISLIAFLMGLILAFVGAIQLRLFGAEIFVADLVGIGIVREMAAIMTGVVMSGRSGAAFAAQLGTMQVNDEIDALRTMGLNPVEFLVIPRLVALTVMMPLLCLYANVMGVLGGMVVGVGILDLGMKQYWRQTVAAVALNDLAVGLVMGLVFGILVSLAGCLRGMQSDRSSAAVGQAATSAVVTSIVWIVVATAVITVICDVLGV